MKEVFEKIVEILENKAYEAEKDMQLSDSYADAQAFGGKQEGYENAIEIVKQEAEKYKNGHFGCNTNGEHERCDGCGLTDCKIRNKIWFGVSDDSNGWIPCSERLPEEYEDVEVTVEEIADDVGGKRYYNVRSWLQDGQWVIKKNPYNPTVIAWKYPTEPYQPKGE